MRFKLNGTVLFFLFCMTTVAAEFPQAEISNGKVHATIYLPSADNGYYRGTRFDWSGVIARLEYAGHNYFGVWFPRYEPTLHDAITGPVEEFRSADGALGYGQAAPGEMFVKVGVGVLQKPDNQPYEFARTYKAVSTGVWLVRPETDRVEFEQDLQGANGYSYIYKKTVKLVRNKPELVIEHSLKNTGKRVIETEVYNHDFYVVDGQPTSSDFSIRFPFAPKAKSDLAGSAEIHGNDLHYLRELRGGHEDTVATYLEGYGKDPKDFDIRLENSKTGAGVRETGSLPISKLYLWSIRSTICPEAYVALRVEPKKTIRWSLKYTFYTLDKKQGEAAK